MNNNTEKNKFVTYEKCRKRRNKVHTNILKADIHSILFFIVSYGSIHNNLYFEILLACKSAEEFEHKQPLTVL